MAAPTVEDLNKRMRALIKELNMIGRTGTQGPRIEAAGFQRYSGLVPLDAIQTAALTIIVGLYEELDDERTHERLLQLIRDAIVLDRSALSGVASAEFMARPEFAGAAAGPGPLTMNNLATGNNNAADDKVIKIVASESVAGAVTESGKVYVWGTWANRGPSVTPPAGLTDVKDLALGYDGAIAVKRDGSVVAWGGDNGSAEVVIPDGLRLKAVYGSEGGFYGIDMDNKIVYLPTTHNTVAIDLPDIEVKGLVLSENYAWGIAIGLDDSAVVFGPSAIAIPTDIKIKTAVIGRDFGLAILTNNRLYAWGERNLNLVTQDSWFVRDVAFGAGCFWVLKDTGFVTQYNLRDGSTTSHATSELAAIAGSTEHVLMLNRAGRVSVYNPRSRAELAVPEEIRDLTTEAAGIVDGNGEVAGEDEPYYETIDQIRFALEAIRPTYAPVEGIVEISKVDGSVFDFSDGEEYESVAEYLQEVGGDGCVFIYKEHLMAFSKRMLAQKVESGESLFYECRRIFPFTPDEGLFGTFEPTDIKRERYVEIPLNGRFTFKLKVAKHLFTSHSIWRIEETGERLPVTASWAMAIHGGPVESAVHCQAGSDKTLFGLTPVKFVRGGAAVATATAAVTTVRVRHGESVKEINVSDDRSVGTIKGLFAAEAGVGVERVRFILGGRELADANSVAPGATIMAMIRPVDGGRRTYRRFTQRNSRASN
jgi:hypothetical protein